MEVTDVVDLSDSEGEELSVPSPDRKRLHASQQDASGRISGSMCDVGCPGMDSLCVQARAAGSLHPSGGMGNKGKEKISEGGSVCMEETPSISGELPVVHGTTWSSEDSTRSGDVAKSVTKGKAVECGGDEQDKFVVLPPEELHDNWKGILDAKPNDPVNMLAHSSVAENGDLDDLLNSQSSSSAADILRADDCIMYDSSSTWLSKVKGLNWPLPDENELRISQIKSDETLARKLQEHFNQESLGFQDSGEVDTTIALTLQEEDAEHARFSLRQDCTNSRDRSMAHLYSFGHHSPIHSFSAQTANHALLPIANRRGMSRRFNSPEMEQQNMIISQLTEGCFRNEQMDLHTRLAVLESLEEAFESCGNPFASDEMYPEYWNSDDDDYENLSTLDDDNHHTGASDILIDSLPLSVVEGEGCSDPCPICLDCPAGGSFLRHLPCLHKFHKECIDTWLRMRISCPVCKSDVI